MNANDSFILPEWLDEFAIEDSLIGQSYEKTPASVRASLKKTIACLSCLYGEIPHERERKTRFNQGLTIIERDMPVSFCLILCPADYSYPERFIASLMPAIFSGVVCIIPCFITEKRVNFSGEMSTVSSSLLAAVDLAGIEFTYLLDREESERLLLFTEKQSSGHIVELVKDKNTQREQLPHFPYTSLYAEREPQRIVNVVQKKESGNSDVFVYTNGLSLHSSLSDIWAWQELTPDMFRKRSFFFE